LVTVFPFPAPVVAGVLTRAPLLSGAQIVYLQSKIALAFRTRLTRYTHDLYLSERQNFYKFGLGLGALAATTTAGSGGADDRKGTGVGGGADQYVAFFLK
jgi:ATP-binding cassette subfamily D (ALD) long-chain fatty acid import protein